MRKPDTCFNQSRGKVNKTKNNYKFIWTKGLLRELQINETKSTVTITKDRIYLPATYPQLTAYCKITQRRGTGLDPENPDTCSRGGIVFHWNRRLFSTIVKQSSALFNSQTYFTDIRAHHHFQLIHYVGKCVIRKTLEQLLMEPCIWVLTFWPLWALCPSPLTVCVSPPHPHPHSAWG